MVAEHKPISVAEFDKFLAAPENRDRLFQLINGEIVEKVVTQEHGMIVGLFVTEINLYLRQNRIGRVGPEIRHRAPGDSDNDLLPDVAFTRDLDKPVTTVGAVPYMPHLAIEVKSPDDTYKAMREKARYYLSMGTQMVWLVFREKHIVEVYTAEDEQILTENDTLTGGNVLPGFALVVRQIFDL